MPRSTVLRFGAAALKRHASTAAPAAQPASGSHGALLPKGATLQQWPVWPLDAPRPSGTQDKLRTAQQGGVSPAQQPRLGAQQGVNKQLDKEGKVLHPDLISSNVKRASFAVRGELLLKADELRKQGRTVVLTNVGNPHQLGAKPVTFIRQVISLASAPFLLDHPRVHDLFPSDAVARARMLLSALNGGVGAYSDSRGCAAIRQQVADFIQRRDGVASNPDHIFLTDGASPAVQLCLSIIIRGEEDGILVPTPEYPLYSASIKFCGGTMVPYMLDEAKQWSLDIGTLERVVARARRQGTVPRAIALVNPGNPTGQCLAESNIRDILQFSHRERLVVLADEVYQETVYQDEKPFVSAKKVLHSLGEPYTSNVEMISFHSASKGTIGECGLRGGYMELTNIHQGTIDEIYKVASVTLCPNTIGQIAVSCMVTPPQAGDPSYEQYMLERSTELASLRRRAHLVTDSFNSLPGVSCQFTEGAMYSFPQIKLPPKALAAAQAAGKAPDTFYCLQLLEEAGISTVPGSGFGQAPGTHHFRTTILPREEVMQEFVEKFRSFHTKFLKRYS